MPRRPSLKLFKNAGVRLEVPVIEFLDRLAVAEQRHRSFMINHIVRKYAESQGQIIPEEFKKTVREQRKA